jgi:hypothetical protein
MKQTRRAILKALGLAPAVALPIEWPAPSPLYPLDGSLVKEHDPNIWRAERHILVSTKAFSDILLTGRISLAGEIEDGGYIDIYVSHGRSIVEKDSMSFLGTLFTESDGLAYAYGPHSLLTQFSGIVPRQFKVSLYTDAPAIAAASVAIMGIDWIREGSNTKVTYRNQKIYV